ncbi:hypothetical protein A9239_02980 [Methanosarcina sp. A14]|nr:hypothetical protein A9239_02980 [Methanosarcina sp. A14]
MNKSEFRTKRCKLDTKKKFIAPAQIFEKTKNNKNLKIRHKIINCKKYREMIKIQIPSMYWKMYASVKLSYNYSVGAICLP